MCLSLKRVSLGFPWWSRIHLSMQGAWVQSLIRELCVCAQSCPTLCDFMNCSPPGVSVHGIFQASILEWVAISFSRGSFWLTQGSNPGFPHCRQMLYRLSHREAPKHKISVQLLSRVRLFATQWTISHQAPLSMGFPKQEYWNGLPFPPPGDLPDTGIKPGSPALQADSLLSEPPGKP